MRLKALRQLNTITEGAIFNLPDAKAIELINAGYAAAFCFWLDKPVPECVKPCSETEPDRLKLKRECPHFAEYWALQKSYKGGNNG